uniref:PDZ domain-containing protein n=1 Tax=Hordeum vulgare subsp. vulgare TaxID=112509 RepID=A0A8I7BBD0_HORVV
MLLAPNPTRQISILRRRRRPSVSGHRPNLLSTMSSRARRKKRIIPTEVEISGSTLGVRKQRRRRLPPTPQEPGPISPALAVGTTQSRIPDEDDEEGQDAKKRNLGISEEEEEEKMEEEEVVSSAPSSPICEPYIPSDGEGAPYNKPICSTICKPLIKLRFRLPAIHKALRIEEDKLHEKLDAQSKLPTLDFDPSACLSDEEDLLPVPESESGREAVLRAADFVLALSSFVDGKPLQRCSGILFEWNDHLKTGVVLTTAHLIRSNCPSIDHWLGKDEYRPDAKVIVHFLDDTSAEGDLLYHQEHYDIAFFKTTSHVHASEDDDNEFDDGGPAVDFSANIVGMINNSTSGSFIPTSILHQCFYFWKNHGRIPRLHLRLKLFAVKLLDLCHLERIRRKCKVDSGLVIEDVSSGSHAEKLGLRRGDIIRCFEGEEVSTTVQLEENDAWIYARIVLWEE